eukprot:UN31588
MDSVLSNKKNRVLVHCYKGVSRAPSFVIGYLMLKESSTNCACVYEKIYNYVKSKRNKINPNVGFVKQLQFYEESGFKIDKANILLRQDTSNNLEKIKQDLQQIELGRRRKKNGKTRNDVSCQPNGDVNNNTIDHILKKLSYIGSEDTTLQKERNNLFDKAIKLQNE